MKRTLTKKRPDYFEPEAGTPNECYSNVYLEVTHNPERVAVLGYIRKDRLCLDHAWYVEMDGTVVDMTLPDKGWNYAGYIIPTEEWVRRVNERGDNRLDVLTDEELLGLGIKVESLQIQQEEQ